MQSLKFLVAFLFFGFGAHAQNMNNSMAHNRLSSFNVAHAGLDGGQINYSAVLNSKYGSNSSLLFETRLGKSNFSLSGQFENSENFFYAHHRKEIGLSYQAKLNNGHSLNFGVGYGKASTSYSYISNLNNYNSSTRSLHTTRFGALYAGKRFKVGAEYGLRFEEYGTDRHQLINLLYQQTIIDRDQFKLTTNLVLSNYSSSLEANLLFNNKYSLTAGYDARRGFYMGAGYKFTEKLEVNMSLGGFPGTPQRTSLQFGIKLAL
ncbi:type IX secretion system membrane protein PorP/SprF [Lishizhenia sp.]|uniref:type IX secretion system membrane protein PorP/SprF n=1 Tax=Lishizhenia sp. TaxID=2497594 RepID=UPI00299E835C|nr:type IX secretion system membrane protein PorP/SprF [Lishizhenia sp.]MDX1444767.1 hypothetical protein [Lishizhenia sp.]